MLDAGWRSWRTFARVPCATVCLNRCRSDAAGLPHEHAVPRADGPDWPAGRAMGGADPPQLERILFHLVQEYARHLGHLDIVSELADGQTGE